MTMNDKQFPDLQVGDVLEVGDERWPEGTVVRGPVWADRNTLRVADVGVRWPDGLAHQGPTCTLTVISRVPRRLYINHERTEPVVGDVVLVEEIVTPLIVFRVAGEEIPDRWIDQYGYERAYEHLSPPRRLRLLVDGETREVVR